MDKTDILVVGGGPAGATAAITAKKSYPSKKVVLVKKEEKSVIPCGIPYIFDRLKSVEENSTANESLSKNGVNLLIDEVIKIKPKEKEVVFKNDKVHGYDKLILALGSKPHLVPIPGIEKKGVWLVQKDYSYLEKFREAVLKSKKVVIIGGGFIGVEFAEELSRINGLEISIVEMLDHCLTTNFDPEFSRVAEEKIKAKGVKIYTGRAVQEIVGDEQATGVVLDDGEKLSADLVILSIGARPNVDLAKETGIQIEKEGAMWVDEYLKTNLPDIFAVGDCAQTKDFITGKNIPIMLASVAASEARIVANNLYQLQLIRENKGTVGVFATYIDDLVLGAVGLTEKRAKEEAFDCLIGEAEAPNQHPATLAGTEKIKVKLIFAKSSEGLLLGGEIMGSKSAGEMLNILAMAVQQQASIFDFNTWQIATHPLLTSAPTVYPIITAAQNALAKLRS
ncbi:MAG: FAD-dependent oxidoreductase [Patescibacteria group bacterium]|nr:FAD-dependent oxidoreductase [Patescibacteria group bacterium]